MGVDLLNMFLDCSSDNLKHPGGQPMVNNGMQSFNPRHWTYCFWENHLLLLLSTVVKYYLRGNKTDWISTYTCITCSCATALPIVESLSENTVTTRRSPTPSVGFIHILHSY